MTPMNFLRSLFWTVVLWNGAHCGLAQEPKSPRTDSVETKLQLLQSAWEQRDFDLARSLADSLRDSVIQAQHEEQLPPAPLIAANDFGEVSQLRRAWQRWADGWQFFKAFAVQENAGIARQREPIELSLDFPSNQITSLARELRVATVLDNRIVEVPCQVYRELHRGHTSHCTVLLLLDSLPNQRQEYLVFYGNPNAELPEYPSDLITQGEGYGLDIANSAFKASLSRQTGQLERLTLRREHGLELFAGGEGHGEPPGIDWAHDYVDEGGFQKLRISLWDQCPDYEVITGPLVTIVRRWGFPHSPVHPVFTPSRLHVQVEYRFYAGLPWFHKIGSMKAIQEFTAEALRDDEWVFSGQSFTDKLWMDSGGKVHVGDAPKEHQEQLWGVGFFHQDSKDAFLALFLEHSAEGLPELKHSGEPLMYYRWHGHVWSRYPLPVRKLPAGAVLRQKNAYVTLPWTAGESQAQVELLRKSMMQPLQLTSLAKVVDDLPEMNQTNRLARTGEAGDAAIDKAKIWEALRDCKDAQLYTADIHVVDLGLVRDVRVRGNVVTLIMEMPHPGRSRLGYFIDGSISVHPTLSVPIRERLLRIPGVHQVVFQQLHAGSWSSNRLTVEGRRKLGLPTSSN